jgi:hypothetical protein
VLYFRAFTSSGQELWALSIAPTPRLVTGQAYLVEDPRPGVEPALRRIVVRAKEARPGDGDSIIGDPTAGGASIEIIANGGTPTRQTFRMPASGWKRMPANRASPPVGYRYRDPSPGKNGPVWSALIAAPASGGFRFKVSILGRNGPGPQPHVTVVPPNPGTDGGAIFTIEETGASYCMSFGGAAGGQVTNAPPSRLFKVTSTRAQPTNDLAGCP